MNRDHPALPLPPADWLLVEVTRRSEEQTGDPPLENHATRTAATLDAPLERRIIERARRLPEGPGWRRRIDGWLSWLRASLLAMPVLGLFFGAGAAGLVETRPGTIALSYALAALLLMPTLMLFLWLLMMLRRTTPDGATGLLGRTAWKGLLLLGRLGLPLPGPLAGALAGFGRRAGRTFAAVATHGLWTGFFIGAIGWLALRFVGLRFDFSWETTLLTGGWMESLILVLGQLPALLPGVELPTPDQARAVLDDVSTPQTRALWAHYLLGALAIYGLLPRLLLLALFGWRWRRIGLTLDLARPGYLRLLPALDEIGSEYDPARGPRAQDDDFERVPAAPPGDGPAVLIGVELDDWPPENPGAAVLGPANDRAQRQAIEQALAGLQTRPQRIIARCSARRSPDRGTGRWLAGLRSTAPVEIELECTDDSARRDSIRIDDWARLAERFGLDFRVLGR
ncbi:MAG: DUF2868 domain-containing protein [Wenzhouxiangellaceae bacterium]|nr:DUF2868 domain-containing protein [Wenzhouxiangellaceae bacterium]